MRSAFPSIPTLAQDPEELSPLAARVILVDRSGAGIPRTVPVLAYTLGPVVSFREDGGEPTSALVAILLSHGFQLPNERRLLSA